MPPEDLIRDLKARSYNVEPTPRKINGADFVVLELYLVEIGQHAGKKIGLAFQTPGDYPMTPPGGIHVRPHLIPIGSRNVHASPLGAEWQYWSRPITEWRNDRGTKRLLSHVNRLMLDA